MYVCMSVGKFVYMAVCMSVTVSMYICVFLCVCLSVSSKKAFPNAVQAAPLLLTHFWALMEKLASL